MLANVKQKFRDWSSHLSFGQKILIISILPIFIETFLLALFFRVYISWKEADEWVSHSQEVLIKTAAFQRDLLEARTNARSYAFFGEQEYIEALRKEIKSYRNDYEELKKLISDNDEQSKLLSTIDSVLLPIDTYYAVINFESKSDTRQIAQLFSFTKQGEILLKSLFVKLDDFTKAELILNEKRKTLQRDRVAEAASVVAIGGVLLLAITFLIGLIYQFAVKERFKDLMLSVQDYSEGKPFVKRLSGKDEVAVLEHAFLQMAKSLQERSAENETFIYGVSHDMRTPLVNLQGFSEELKFSIKEIEELTVGQNLKEENRIRFGEILSVDLQKSTKFITSAVARLSSIIDGLLRLSRVGKVDYHLKTMDPNPILERIVLSIDLTLRSRNAEIRCEKLPIIFSDIGAFEQIFANLLTNAVNYLDPNRAGKIEVGVSKETTNDIQTTIYIKDNGLGFPESFKAKLFQPFQRYHPVTAQGEGIGLAIVHRLVDRIKANIDVESKVGFGTTFSVSFPNHPPPATDLT